jgi:protein-disulfide isomerase
MLAIVAISCAQPVAQTSSHDYESISLEPWKIEGAPAASIALIEFGDFESWPCARFSKELLPVLRARYIEPGRILFSFYQFPLDKVHPHARLAAERAVCGARRGSLVATQNQLFESFRGGGLASLTHDACSPFSPAQDVAKDESLGRGLRVVTVPTFFVGTVHGSTVTLFERFSESGSLSVFSSAIERVSKRLSLTQR